MKWSWQARAIVVLFISCLLVAGQGRLEAMGSHEDDRANATARDSSSDGNKISLKLCVPRDCKTKGESWSFKPCICCLVMDGVPCWHSYKECQANCRSCNPECSSQSTKKLHV